jgi:LysM repeat protein
MKKQIHIITSPLLALAVVSCASQQPDTYDTPNPYGAADAGQSAPYGDHAPNPVYDTPAAYEEGAPVPTAPPYVDTPAIPTAPTAPGSPAIASSGTPIIHTVVRGDTLSGLSSKYNVPISSIKQANQMTNDIVVLGRKMVIPPR